MIMGRRIKIAVFLIIMFGLTMPAESAEVTGASSLKITAESMTADTLERLVTFAGQVRAEYGDILIRADKVKAFYNRTNKKLNRLEASGNVTITENSRCITGDKAVFDQVTGKITVSGNLRITDGKSSIEGEFLVVDIFAQQGEITGGVSATFQLTESALSEIKEEEKENNFESFTATDVTLRDMEKKLIFETLKKANGNKMETSRILGVSVRTIRNKLNEYKNDGAIMEETESGT